MQFYHFQILSLINLLIAPGFLLIWGRLINNKGAFYSLLFLLTTNLSVLIITSFLLKNYNLIYVFNLESWIKIKLFRIEWCFVYTSFNTTMLISVQLITFFVVTYSYFYMEKDPHLIRYFGYISLFVLFMQILITANNYVSLFFGWEGVGICSYLLVNFWFTRLNANKSAIKAVLVNRIGDLSLILGITLIYFLTGSCAFDIVLSITPLVYDTFIFFLQLKISATFLLSVFLLFGAVGKSAQIGLHIWLPDAMEGPTPISALIHAATMVTAGVLLIIKSAVIFENSTYGLFLMLFLGSLTTFFAASIGLLQTDIKKIIAYSTCSQIGYMIYVCGLSNYTTSFFHLTNHAFFKALLFLCAGSLIHNLVDEQDLRKIGGLMTSLIFTATCFFIGSITLIGLPFLSGFYSKDYILELSFSKYTITGTSVYCIGIATVIFTSIYSYKIYYWCFISQYLNNQTTCLNLKESPWIANLTLFSLTIGSVFFGWYNKDKFIGLGNNFFGSTCYVNINNNNVIAAEFISQIIKIIPFFLILFSVLIVINLLQFNILISYKSFAIYKFVLNKWFFDYVYNKLINEPLLTYSYATNFLKLDKGLFEVLETRGLVLFFNKTNVLINYKLTHTGVFFNYGSFLILYVYLNFVFFGI